MSSASPENLGKLIKEIYKHFAGSDSEEIEEQDTDWRSSRNLKDGLAKEIGQLKASHAKENDQLMASYAKELAQLEVTHDREIAQLKRNYFKRARESSGGAQLKRSKVMDDERTLVCVVKGTHESTITITISADTFVFELMEKICEENASQLGYIDVDKLDVRCTMKHTKKGTRYDKDGCIVMEATKCIRDYFPSDRVYDSGTVHIVAEATPTFSRITSLTDRPKKELSRKEEEEEAEYYNAVKKELNLFVHWSIGDIEFSHKHCFPHAQWLEYSRYCDSDRARVFIGDKATWRELYIACNECIRLAEGKVPFRFVEGFNESMDRLTLQLVIGT